MIASNNKGRYIVECHIPLNFIRSFPHQDTLWHDTFWHAYAEWRDAMHGKEFLSDARRYGKVNRGQILFWVEEVGPLVYGNRVYGNRWAPVFEMTIRASVVSNLVTEILQGSHGAHFFLINIELDPRSTPDHVKVSRFLTPVLMARYLNTYAEAMDLIFADLLPYFNGRPDPSRLPTSSLRF